MRVDLFNRQRRIELDLGRLQVLAIKACRACLRYPGSGSSVLTQLVALEISIVSDPMMAKVHRRFLNVRGSTDVITFEHGEILISAAKAAEQAGLEEEAIDREVARYIIHGILHLNGHLDKERGDAESMWRVQEAVLQSLWPKL